MHLINARNMDHTELLLLHVVSLCPRVVFPSVHVIHVKWA